MTPWRAATFILMLIIATSAAPREAAAAGLTLFVEKDAVSVMAEGANPKERFALVFSRKAGSISVWHDLAADPKMAVNLSARGEGNGGALFQNHAEILLDRKEYTIFPGPAEEMTVTESSAVRVIIVMKGRYTTPAGDYPGEDLAKAAIKMAGREIKGPERPRYETQFTVYPTGRVFIRHVLEVRGDPIEFRSNRILLATAPGDRVETFNDQAMRELRFVRPSSYVVHAGTEPIFSANALFVVSLRQYPTDWLGQMMMFDSKRTGWTRSGFLIHGPRDVAPGKYVWNFMLQVEPNNIRTREVADLYARDYLQPGRLIFTPGKGSAELGDAQDEQLDGFVEGRGAYLLSADGKSDVEFSFDAGDEPRYAPAFELRAWRHGPPASLSIDGVVRQSGVHYQAHCEKSTLILQYLGVFSPGEHRLHIEAPAAAQSPASPAPMPGPGDLLPE